jgi:transcriptional regulator with XRE-family HTH domain
MPVNRKSSRLAVNGKALSDLRIAARLRLEDIADALGCHKAQVSRWEQEESVPSEENIHRMAEILKSYEFVKGNPRYKFGRK